MTETEFNALAAQGYNRIALVARIMSDMETPLSIYCKLANRAHTFLLESVEGETRFARYSFVGLQASTRITTTLTAEGPVTVISVDGREQSRFTGDDPLKVIERFMAGFKVASPKGMPRLTGGLVGYFGYDTVRFIEPGKLPVTEKHITGAPVIDLFLCEELVVIDNLKGRSYIVLNVDPASPTPICRPDAACAASRRR